jgi:hypothetical protein
MVSFWYLANSLINLDLTSLPLPEKFTAEKHLHGSEGGDIREVLLYPY